MSQKRSLKPSRGSNHGDSTITADTPLDFQEELERYQASIKGLEVIQGKLKLRLEAFEKLLEEFTKAKEFQVQISQSFYKYTKGNSTCRVDIFTQNLVNGRIGQVNKEIDHLIKYLELYINEQANEPIPWYKEEIKHFKEKIDNHKDQVKGYIEKKDATSLRDLIRDQEEFRKSNDRIHPSHKYL